MRTQRIQAQQLHGSKPQRLHSHIIDEKCGLLFFFLAKKIFENWGKKLNEIQQQQKKNKTRLYFNTLQFFVLFFYPW